MQGAPTGHPVGKMPEEPTGFHRLRQKALGKLHKEVGEGKWERRPRKGSTLFFRPPLPPISGGDYPGDKVAPSCSGITLHRRK